MWQFGELPANHRAGGYALEARGMAIAVPDDLQESVGPGADGCAWQVGVLPAKHRASGCALEARGMAIAVPDELQESVGQGSNRALTAVCSMAWHGMSG